MNSEAKTLLIIVLVLLSFGLLVLSSAGIVEAQRKFDSPYHYFNRQLLNGVLPGLFLFFILSKINYKRWNKFSLPIMFLAVFLLTLVLVPSVGHGLRGATRWLNLGFLPTFQPSEFAKLALILYIAAFFSSKKERIKDIRQGLIPFLIIMGFVSVLLLMQPDFGTLVTMAAISFAIYFFAGAKWKHIILIILFTGAAFLVLSLAAPYRMARINAFLNPQEDTLGISYQLNQAQLAIGSGGITGVGYGKSVQKFKYLPEPASDSIFAVLSEELGLIGSFSVLILFGILLMTLIRIAKKTTDNFGSLVVLGIAVWVFSQTFINIGGITHLIPITGLPLPFFSFGSTSLAAILSAMGIAYNVAKNN